MKLNNHTGAALESNTPHSRPEQNIFASAIMMFILMSLRSIPNTTVSEMEAKVVENTGSQVEPSEFKC